MAAGLIGHAWFPINKSLWTSSYVLLTAGTSSLALTFCYALIPDSPEFMHPGEHAMDTVAVNLINEAWEMFQGHEPVDEQGTVREAALALARTQLGYAESPAGSNNNKYAVWYGKFNYQPWCAIFATWCYETNGVGSSPSFLKGSRYSYVPYIVADGRERKNGLKTVDPSEVRPGDLVCYDWQWNGEYDHVGLFEKWVGPSTFEAVEGNTSVSSDSNGGQVMRYHMDQIRTVYLPGRWKIAMPSDGCPLR